MNARGFFEDIIAASLDRLRIPYERQFSVRPYRIDFRLQRLFGLEVDESHHLERTQFEYDRRREQQIMEQTGILLAQLDEAVIRRWILSANYYERGAKDFDLAFRQWLADNSYGFIKPPRRLLAI